MDNFSLQLGNDTMVLNNLSMELVDCLEISQTHFYIRMFLLILGSITNLESFSAIVRIKSKKPVTYVLLSISGTDLILAIFSAAVTILEESTSWQKICANNTVVSVVGTYVDLFTEYNMDFAEYGLFFYSITYAAFIVELFTIVTSSVNIIIAVWWPFKYKTIVTKFRTCLSLIIIWIVVYGAILLFAGLSLYYANSTVSFRQVEETVRHSFDVMMYILALLACCVIALLLFSYIFIFNQIKQQKKLHRISSTKKNSLTKSSVTIFFILAFSSLCWLPFAVNTLIAGGVYWDLELSSRNVSLQNWSQASGYFLILLPLVNSLVYSIRDRQVREIIINDIMKICCFWKKISRSKSPVSTDDTRNKSVNVKSVCSAGNVVVNRDSGMHLEMNCTGGHNLSN